MKSLHHLDAKDLRFSVFSSKNVKELSVAKIITPLVFDQLGHALPGGLYDPKMGKYHVMVNICRLKLKKNYFFYTGPFAISSDPCATCYRTLNCNGHMGHIELSMLVYNPIFMKIVCDILRITCLSCFRLQISDNLMEILTIQLKLLDAGYITEAQEIDIFKSDVIMAKSKEEQDPKLEEFTQLVKNKTFNSVANTKNSEALRNSIVGSSIKSTPSKKCMHCKEALKKARYTFKKLMVTVMKSEIDASQ